MKYTNKMKMVLIDSWAKGINLSDEEVKKCFTEFAGINSDDAQEFLNLSREEKVQLLEDTVDFMKFAIRDGKKGNSVNLDDIDVDTIEFEEIKENG